MTVKKHIPPQIIRRLRKYSGVILQMQDPKSIKNPTAKIIQPGIRGKIPFFCFAELLVAISLSLTVGWCVLYLSWTFL